MCMLVRVRWKSSRYYSELSSSVLLLLLLWNVLFVGWGFARYLTTRLLFFFDVPSVERASSKIFIWEGGGGLATSEECSYRSRSKRGDQPPTYTPHKDFVLVGWWNDKPACFFCWCVRLAMRATSILLSLRVLAVPCHTVLWEGQRDVCLV